jgi:tRNA (Thr-GGU) A37 N-methylase
MNITVKNSTTIRCGECGAVCSKEESFIIDGKNICSRCLFGNISPVKIYPIGFVSNKQERDNSDFGLCGKSRISRIDLFPSQKQFMYKLEDERNLTIVYYLHKARPVRARFKRGLDGKEVGVFASRTPDRLSRIGIQDVRLVKVEGTTLVVKGLDAINGTPVLDIKLKRKTPCPFI